MLDVGVQLHKSQAGSWSGWKSCSGVLLMAFR